MLSPNITQKLTWAIDQNQPPQGLLLPTSRAETWLPPLHAVMIEAWVSSTKTGSFEMCAMYHFRYSVNGGPHIYTLRVNNCLHHHKKKKINKTYYFDCTVELLLVLSTTINWFYLSQCRIREA